MQRECKGFGNVRKVKKDGTPYAKQTIVKHVIVLVILLLIYKM